MKTQHMATAFGGKVEIIGGSADMQREVAKRLEATIPAKTTPTASHTPGALRAADAIRLQLSATNITIARDRLAKMIDEATAAPELLEALKDAEQALAHALYRLKDDGSFSTSIALKGSHSKARSALAL